MNKSTKEYKYCPVCGRKMTKPVCQCQDDLFWCAMDAYLREERLKRERLKKAEQNRHGCYNDEE